MTNFLTAPGVEYAWRTDIGRVRSRNEDNVAVDAGTGLLVVADGMGGHNAGDVASRMAIEGVIGAMQRSTGEADDRLADWAALLLEQATLAEGGALDDPAGFVRRINRMLLDGGRPA